MNYKMIRLLFYQKGGIGDYSLYNPSANSPKDLVGNPRRAEKRKPYPDDWDETDIGAYLVLKELVSPEEANASVSLIPSSSGFLDRLPSSILLAEVQKYPQKKVNDAYVYNILEHKATVEVSYSVRFMGNRSAVSVLENPAGLAEIPRNQPETREHQEAYRKIERIVRLTTRACPRCGTMVHS
jgi:hypothetical protein